jgi:hypothetical protein
MQAARREIARWRRRAKSHFRSQLEEAGVEAERSRIVVREMRPWGVVRRTLKEFSRPLLVLGTRAHNALSRALRGSLANDALMSLNCDVLVGPTGRDKRPRRLPRTHQGSRSASIATIDTRRR